MINMSELVESSGWKNFMAKLYGIGAAVVLYLKLCTGHWLL